MPVEPQCHQHGDVADGSGAVVDDHSGCGELIAAPAVRVGIIQEADHGSVDFPDHAKACVRFKFELVERVKIPGKMKKLP